MEGPTLAPAETDTFKIVSVIRWLLLKATSASGAVFISTQTASGSSSIDFTSGIDGTYSEYLVVISNVLFVANNNAIWVQISQDAGSSWKAGATDYIYQRSSWDEAGTVINGGSTGNTAFRTDPSAGTINGVTNRVLAGEFRLFDPSLTGTFKNMDYHASYYNGNFIKVRSSGQYITDGGVINGIRFLAASGNISTGTFSLYGLRKS